MEDMNEKRCQLLARKSGGKYEKESTTYRFQTTVYSTENHAVLTKRVLHCHYYMEKAIFINIP